MLGWLMIPNWPYEWMRMVVCLLCLCVALWWTGDMSWVYPASRTMTAGISSTFSQSQHIQASKFKNVEMVCANEHMWHVPSSSLGFWWDRQLIVSIWARFNYFTAHIIWPLCPTTDDPRIAKKNIHSHIWITRLNLLLKVDWKDTDTWYFQKCIITEK